MRDEAVPELKASLGAAFARQVRLSGLDQKTVAARLGVTQPRVSQVLGGDMESLSVARLIQHLLRMGVDVDVHLSPGTGRVRVISTLPQTPHAVKRGR